MVGTVVKNKEISPKVCTQLRDDIDQATLVTCDLAIHCLNSSNEQR